MDATRCLFVGEIVTSPILTECQLNELLSAVFVNAESLLDEAEELFKLGRFARAYLLAHFCIEELGKLPIIVGVWGQIKSGEKVDWTKFHRRFRNHSAKVKANTFHHYVFGIAIDLIKNSDVKWCNEKMEKAAQYVEKKNNATYVDIVKGIIKNPIKDITEESAQAVVKFARESINAHLFSQELIGRTPSEVSCN